MRVLVVEDEPRLAKTLEMGLAAEGFVVVTAENGADGLWLTRSSRPGCPPYHCLIATHGGLTAARVGSCPCPAAPSLTLAE